MAYDPTSLSWEGRFPKNEIISLLDVNRPFNLAESTAKDLSFGELLDLVGLDSLRDLKLGYGSSAGLPALRAAVAGICGVAPEAVISTQGTALGLFLLAFELCRPGDEVVIATPCFPPSRDALVGCGVALREVAQRFDEGYRLDLVHMAKALTPGTRMVSVGSPGNPNGVRLSEGTLRELLNLMAERSPRAFLFVDETYREATYGGPTPASAAVLDPRVIVGGSVSKAHGAPGLRVGWLIVSDPTLRERLTVAKMNVVISGSPLDEALAAGLLSRHESVLAPRRAMLAEALGILGRWQAGESARLDWVRPDGGALCCLRLRPDCFDDVAVARFWAALPGHDLQLAPGAWFGEEERIFRLGFGYLPIGGLTEALAALTRAMNAVLDNDSEP
jgi:aspartate/methionine/tyrosine aminotransferase